MKRRDVVKAGLFVAAMTALVGVGRFSLPGCSLRVNARAADNPSTSIISPQQKDLAPTPDRAQLELTD